MRYTILLLALVITGCLSSSYTPTLYYAVEPQATVSPGKAGNETLGIRPIEPALPYRQRIVYRDANHVLGYYDNAEWAEMPREVVMRALTDALAATGRFSDVGNAADMRSPDLVLTGQLRKFDEVRTQEPWAAECEIRLELRAGIEREAVWAATLNAREDLESNDLPGLTAAMGRAVARVVEQAAAALGRVD